MSNLTLEDKRLVKRLTELCGAVFVTGHLMAMKELTPDEFTKQLREAVERAEEAET